MNEDIESHLKKVDVYVKQHAPIPPEPRIQVEERTATVWNQVLQSRSAARRKFVVASLAIAASVILALGGVHGKYNWNQTEGVGEILVDVIEHHGQNNDERVVVYDAWDDLAEVVASNQ